MASPTTPATAVLVRGITRQVPIPSCSLGIDDLHRLFQILQRKASEAADEQIAGLQQQQGQTPEQFNSAKGNVRSLLNLVVRVQGSNGEPSFLRGGLAGVFHDELRRLGENLRQPEP
jgi:hypothetical protein